MNVGCGYLETVMGKNALLHTVRRVLCYNNKYHQHGWLLFSSAHAPVCRDNINGEVETESFGA